MIFQLRAHQEAIQNARPEVRRLLHADHMAVLTADVCAQRSHTSTRLQAVHSCFSASVAGDLARRLVATARPPSTCPITRPVASASSTTSSAARAAAGHRHHSDPPRPRSTSASRAQEHSERYPPRAGSRRRPVTRLLDSWPTTPSSADVDSGVSSNPAKITPSPQGEFLSVKVRSQPRAHFRAGPVIVQAGASNPQALAAETAKPCSPRRAASKPKGVLRRREVPHAEASAAIPTC